MRKSLILAMNRSELAEDLRQRGVRAQRGMRKEDLVRLSEKGGKGQRDPVDDLRKELMALLTVKGDRLKIIGCPSNSIV